MQHDYGLGHGGMPMPAGGEAFSSSNMAPFLTKLFQIVSAATTDHCIHSGPVAQSSWRGGLVGRTRAGTRRTTHVASHSRARAPAALCVLFIVVRARHRRVSVYFATSKLETQNQ